MSTALKVAATVIAIVFAGKTVGDIKDLFATVRDGYLKGSWFGYFAAYVACIVMYITLIYLAWES